LIIIFLSIYPLCKRHVINKYTVLVQADKLKGIIPIPSQFEHKEVEVVISLPGKKHFDPKKYRGLGNAEKEKIDQDIIDIRAGWSSHE